MAQMTGGEALAKSLYREGVRVIFGLPGVQLYQLLDGLAKEPGIRFINTRHEQATTYMADGYSRTGAGIGTALVVPGPGLQNASAGIGTAYAASSPILVVSGQIERDHIGKEGGKLHEVKDLSSTISSVTKHNELILDPKRIPQAVHKAFAELKTGRPRPVEIEIPPETLGEIADVDLLEPAIHTRPGASKSDLIKCVELIMDSKKPIIWAGGGVISSNASTELTALAEYIQSPVLCTAEGKGSISDRNPLSIGGYRFKNDTFFENNMPEYDLVIAIGSRIQYPEYLSGKKVLQIDIDQEELSRNYKNAEGILGDAKETISGILKILQTQSKPRPDATTSIKTLRQDRYNPSTILEPQESYVQAIRSAMPDDGILISGMNQIGYYSRNRYDVYEPRTYITSSYYGNLGYAYPTALGAKVAQPDKAVVAISGDGGFMFNVQELSTAVRHKINVVVVVFNDNAYGNVKRDQINLFDGRAYGADVTNPDFMKLSDAFGVHGMRVKSGDPKELEKCLKTALNLDTPVLIEVPVSEMPNPFDAGIFSYINNK